MSFVTYIQRFLEYNIEFYMSIRFTNHIITNVHVFFSTGSTTDARVWASVRAGSIQS